MRIVALCGLICASLATIGPVEARALTCKVPRIEVCSDCLRRVTVTVLPGGACRIAYEIAPASAASASEVPPADPRLTVMIPDTVTLERRRRTSPHARAQAPRRSRLAARPLAGRDPNAARCFTFNGKSFCE